MGSAVAVPTRQVHLDFHTSPAIPDIGKDFDGKRFAAMMKKAHVNSVTLFAKCHHGHLYYNTSRPERHPGLKKGFGLLEKQVEALQREGIRTPIYLSVQCDEYAANTHPEWVARKPDGSQVKWGDNVFKAGWQILDMSSPYQDFLAEQTEEVLKHFAPVDGLFFDMCWDQPSTTLWAIDGMTQRKMNPESESDRRRYAHDISLEYMKRFYDLTKKYSKNGGVYFNSRPLSNLAEEAKYLAQIEIEALPSGGWGYMYFPKNVRFVRTFGKPYLGMTARFHKSWADFGGLKPYAALEYETSQMMAHGASCSIGDQLHPRGILDIAAYDLIGKTYARVESREPWLIDAKPVAQIALLTQPPVNPANNLDPIGGSDEGATRMLTQLKHQFNIVNESSNWDAYELLVLPDTIALSDSLTKKLRRYIADGGKILASGTSGLSPDGSELLLPELGIKPQGLSPFTSTYIRFGGQINEAVPDTDHVMYDRSVRVLAGKGTTSLATVVEPYFERSWDHFSSHFQTPPDQPSKFSAAVQNGQTAYIAYPIFNAYAIHANLPCRWLVSALIDRLIPDPLLRVTAPSSTETSVTRQGKRTIVHLLQYCPERRGKDLDIIEDIVPLYDVKLSLKLTKKPAAVYIAPAKQPIEFEYTNGRVELVVPEINGHAMVVFE
jgi:hypothetical protein